MCFVQHIKIISSKFSDSSIDEDQYFYMNKNKNQKYLNSLHWLKKVLWSSREDSFLKNCEYIWKKMIWSSNIQRSDIIFFFFRGVQNFQNWCIKRWKPLVLQILCGTIFRDPKVFYQYYHSRFWIWYRLHFYVWCTSVNARTFIRV